MMGYDRSKWTKQQEMVAIRSMLSAAEDAALAKEDVILDNTFLTPRIPNMARNRLSGNVVFSVKSFLDVPIEECIRRDAERENPVGEAVIRKMVKTSAGARKNGWNLTDEYMNIWPVTEPYAYIEDLPRCIIVDLDGTMAIHDGRSPYEYSKVYSDLVSPEVLKIVDQWFALRPTDEDMVIFLSGRPETDENEFNVRAETERWIAEKLPFYLTNSHLFMRPPHTNHIPDFVIKYELFEKFIKGRYNVDFALDDRTQVVRLWRSMNIKTFQCDWGNF